jgi:ABC-type uncharacterized transport system permease subunit
MFDCIILTKEFTVPMSIVDYIPVFLFGMACIILLKSFTKDMNKVQFSLFSCGVINVFIAGFLKATYKLLYAANVCDFEALNKMFFPVQSISFLMAGVGLIWYVLKNKKTYLLSVPPVFSGTFLFVGFMCGGLLLLDIALCIIAKRMKKPLYMILFIISFVCSLCMGYLSSQDFAQASMNWIAEGVNIIGQGSLLVGVLLLNKKQGEQQ